MTQEQDIKQKEEHEERKTEVYSISDALHELEVDLRHNAKFPSYDNERADRIRIHTGFLSPSIVISKAQCKRWIRNHFNESRVSQQGKHWKRTDNSMS